jgi:hypothetical protein
MIKYVRGRADQYKEVDDGVLVDNIKSKGLVFPEFNEYLKRVVVFSGNLDLRKINEISSFYGVGGINVSREFSQRVLEVKNKRNKIAHGELSMLDAGKCVKTSDLRKSHESVDLVLREVISCFKKCVL